MKVGLGAWMAGLGSCVNDFDDEFDFLEPNRLNGFILLRDVAK